MNIKSRFKREISGELGEYWKESAQKEVERAVRWATNEAIVEKNGAICWKKNKRYFMDDLCEMLEYAGFSFSREETRKMREKQVTKELTEYRKKNRNKVYSDEEMYEMRAAFGPGTRVVDILTGQSVSI